MDDLRFQLNREPFCIYICMSSDQSKFDRLTMETSIKRVTIKRD
jgi:hypothetical protein